MIERACVRDRRRPHGRGRRAEQRSGDAVAEKAMTATRRRGTFPSASVSVVELTLRGAGRRASPSRSTDERRPGDRRVLDDGVTATPGDGYDETSGVLTLSTRTCRRRPADVAIHADCQQRRRRAVRAGPRQRERRGHRVRPGRSAASTTGGYSRGPGPRARSRGPPGASDESSLVAGDTDHHPRRILRHPGVGPRRVAQRHRHPARRHGNLRLSAAIPCPPVISQLIRRTEYRKRTSRGGRVRSQSVRCWPSIVAPGSRTLACTSSWTSARPLGQVLE